MHSSSLSLFAVLLSATCASAQVVTVPRPGMVAAPAAAADAVQSEPLVVQATVPSGAVITGNNTATIGANAAGVTGSGLVGVTGEGFLTGGIFTGTWGTALVGNGRYFGLRATCQAGSGEGCAAVSGQTPSGTALAGEGVVGVYGRALPNLDFISHQESLAGWFVGPVRVTGDLHLEGGLNAPIITQLTTQLASLAARLSVLEARLGGSGSLIPGRIQAEDYDRGGQGVGYSDSTPGNTGGFYRTDDVDIKDSADGGYTVGWMNAGEWLSYTLDVPETGSYAISARVGSALPGRTFHVEVNGVDVTGPVAVPNNGAWDTFATVSLGSVNLSAGRQVLRFVVGGEDYFDFTWFDVTRS